MNIGFLCPGQASQKVGMGIDLYQKTDLGKKYFDIANEIMENDILDDFFKTNIINIRPDHKDLLSKKGNMKTDYVFKAKDRV